LLPLNPPRNSPYSYTFYGTNRRGNDPDTAATVGALRVPNPISLLVVSRDLERLYIIAGHLLISLMGSSGQSLRIITLSIILRAQILLIILEIAVAFIQSYVFTILRTLYRSEI